MNGKLSDIEWVEKGNQHLKKNELEEAFESFQMAINVNSENAIAWYKKGTILHKQRKYDEAYNCYDRALLLDPSLEEAEDKRADLILISHIGTDIDDEDGENDENDEEFLSRERTPEEWEQHYKKKTLSEIEAPSILFVMGILFFISAILSLIGFIYSSVHGFIDIGALISVLLSILSGIAWLAIAGKFHTIAKYLKRYVPEKD